MSAGMGGSVQGPPAAAGHGFTVPEPEHRSVLPSISNPPEPPQNPGCGCRRLPQRPRRTHSLCRLLLVRSSGTSLRSMTKFTCCRGRDGASAWAGGLPGDPSPRPALLRPFPEWGGSLWACLGDGGQVGAEVVHRGVDVGEGAAHGLGEPGVADEGAHIAGPARERCGVRRRGGHRPRVPLSKSGCC